MEYEKHAPDADIDLVNAAQSGNDTARDLLFKRYKYFVRSLTHSLFLMGGDEDDLFQEGVWGLLNAITRFDTSRGVPFSEYAKLSIRAAVFTAIRRQAGKKHDALNNSISLNSSIGEEDADLCLIDVIPTLSNVDYALGQTDAQIFMEQAQEVLTKFEYSVLTLYLRGNTYKEVAQLLGRSIKAVDNAMRRIRKKLAPLAGINFEEDKHD